ncbi:Papain family cysteine protease family protein [Theileria parva strain Muguga]|uniref:Cysteine proteinase, putative n=1 Tax=Theileria parva TaxID=5875 RepID=Q4N067_THEPA|nr:Papain family cysteine protease family protein [Theileria parva strain Muguga]EAN31019.1 Papain family cysteine protease family protein [Theileria parva strain Muguga]|eukprot:XP_763302.1 cysteine proteinase [Theileria parva strain Muguga]
MVSSVVSNPNERLVNNRVENDLESSDDTLSTQAKPVSRLLTRKLLLGVVVLFFLAGVSVVSYFLFSKYKMLNKFKRELDDHLTKDFPNLERSKRDTCFDELTRLFGDGFLSDDPKLEYEVYREFEEFNSKYNRRHATQQERLNRLVTFRSNYLEVKEQKGDEPYVKGINRFSDLTEREFYKMFPVNEFSYSDLPYKDHILDNVSNPTYLKNLKKALNTVEDVDPRNLTGENLDWRRADGVTKVKDQVMDECYSCWAFSTVASVESLYRIYRDETVDLSEQELVDCDKLSGGCFTGSPFTAMEYVCSKGLSSSRDVPYRAKVGKCSYGKYKKKFVNTYFVASGLDILNKSLVVSPTVVPINLSREFLTYQSGVYNGSCGHYPNHVVVLVGEGFDEKTGLRYWVLKNSWGPDWGENGFLRLARPKGMDNKCGVLSVGLTPVLYSS